MEGEFDPHPMLSFSFFHYVKMSDRVTLRFVDSFNYLYIRGVFYCTNL